MPLMRSRDVFAFALLALAFPLAIHGDPPGGTEYQINLGTTGDQRAPDVAAVGDEFLVVWQSPVSPGNDDSSLSVVLRRAGAEGAPTGSELQVNTYTTGSQRNPKIASRTDGSAVVVWVSSYPGVKGSLGALAGRSYDTASDPTGPEFQIYVAPNVYTNLTDHDVGAGSSGDFVVAVADFYNNYQGGYLGRAVRRRFDAAGTRLDSTSVSTSNQDIYRVALGGEDTGFVMAWQSYEYFGNYSSVEAQRLAGDGTAVGSSVDLHPGQDFASGNDVTAATDSDGGFFVVWDGLDNYDGYDRRIYGRGVDSMGTVDPAGPQPIEQNTQEFQGNLDIARNASGQFLVVWQSNSAPGDNGFGIRGRFLDADGLPLGDEFGINTYTTGNQALPRVAGSRTDQSFLVVWESPADGTDTDGLSIRGRRIQPESLFSDGFESGDVTAWSNTVP